jgi:hypothetical protein
VSELFRHALFIKDGYSAKRWSVYIWLTLYVRSVDHSVSKTFRIAIKGQIASNVPTLLHEFISILTNDSFSVVQTVNYYSFYMRRAVGFQNKGIFQHGWVSCKPMWTMYGPFGY